MHFGPIPIKESIGAILAHTIRVDKNIYKKGHVLTKSDVKDLEDFGLTEIVGAVLENDDIAENMAAKNIADSISGNGIYAGSPFTGRCNLFSKKDGLFLGESNFINSINSVNETITVGTLPHCTAVSTDQMVATIKVIPFSSSKKIVDKCILTAKNTIQKLRVNKWSKLNISLIQSRLTGTKESVLDSTTASLEFRLNKTYNSINSEIRCSHNIDEIRSSILSEVKKNQELIIIAGASAIVDRRDIIPSAIVAAGGTIEHFGMPVDPGNLLLLGSINDVKIIGLPGCARSPKLNGFDLVLNRILAGVNVGSNEIMSMGSGGLLIEIASRPMPRENKKHIEYKNEKNISNSGKKKIASIILAAGQSRRMGDKNKLLEYFNDKPIINHSIDSALLAKINPIHVITGYQEKEILAVATKNKDITFVHNPEYENGMSTSIKAGLRSLPEEIDAVLILLGDMPLVDVSIIERLITNFNPQAGQSIGVPVTKGKRGNPILWSKQYFQEIEKISGDVGAKHLIGEFSEGVYEIECDKSVITDIDTPENLRKINKNIL
tara:strand:+ start:1468 stop:3117 length:1650 start_codon:yes stop_codon:yes gene_type:complete